MVQQHEWWRRLLPRCLMCLLVVQCSLVTCEGGNHHRTGHLWQRVVRQEIMRLLDKLTVIKDKDEAQTGNLLLQEENPTEESLRIWLQSANEEMRRRIHLQKLAYWDCKTNITDLTERKSMEESKKYTKFLKSLQKQGRLFDIQMVNSPDLKRQYHVIMDTIEPSDDAKSQLIDELEANMSTLYSTAEVCLDEEILVKLPNQVNSSQRCLSLDPDLTNVMSESRDPEVLKAVWIGWRDAAGKPQKDNYQQYVRLKNEGAREHGYKNAGEFDRQDQFDETTDVDQMIADLWEEMRPLYLQLHAFVRRKLTEHYGVEVVGTDRTIRADLLGNMWAQEWDIYPLVAPYPDVPAAADVDSALKEKYDVMGLFRVAEQFYTSIGLYRMTDTFWNKSMFVRPQGREVQCHASASDLSSPGDFRIKMCAQVNRNDFETVHHEMGHVEYDMAYEHQPFLYRDGANAAFHEAVGDTIALSVMSPAHLRRLGLLKGGDSDLSEKAQEKQTINTLMVMALKKIAFLPFGLTVEKWRWQVFAGTTTPQHYNRDWWKLRLELQGLRPPVTRSEEDFDPAAKFHIPANSPYICYFVSHVLQFQFHQQLCKLSGHQGPLHACDIQGSLTAGASFRRMLSAGSSRPWQDVLEEFTGSRVASSAAILEYFKPLYNWLKRDNEIHNVTLGWDLQPKEIADFVQRTLVGSVANTHREQGEFPPKANLPGRCRRQWAEAYSCIPCKRKPLNNRRLWKVNWNYFFHNRNYSLSE